MPATADTSSFSPSVAGNADRSDHRAVTVADHTPPGAGTTRPSLAAAMEVRKFGFCAARSIMVLEPQPIPSAP